MAKLKYWKPGTTSNNSTKGLVLNELEKFNSADRVFSVSKSDNKIVFFEECDGYYSAEYTKEQALELIDELRDWIVKS